MNIEHKELQVLANRVVEWYVAKKQISPDTANDARDDIIRRFERMYDKIQRTYRGKASYTTYCISILNRICCDSYGKIK